MTPVIKLKDVSTVYEGERRPAIKNINLTLEEGELAYIIGPNAAGKTTLLETINGLLSAFKGKVSVFDLDVRKYGREIRCQIGYVPQDFMVNPGEPYTALDVVLMGRYGKIGIIRRSSREDKEKAIKAMRLLGVEELANRPVGKLSGGQQQKIMIARALAKEPRIFLLDEPFSNLDPESRDKVSTLINQIRRENNITTIIVTHDISQISGSCHRIIVMNGGRIIADDEPDKALSMLKKFLPKEYWWSKP